MKAKALIRFNAYNFTAQAGDIINFEREEDAQMLLNLGWIEPLQESESKSKAAGAKKKNGPTE